MTCNCPNAQKPQPNGRTVTELQEEVKDAEENLKVTVEVKTEKVCERLKWHFNLMGKLNKDFELTVYLCLQNEDPMFHFCKTADIILMD